MRKLTLFFLLMILCCTGNSQTMSKITPEQLRITNLIFAEHEYQSKLIPYLQNQIDNLKFGIQKSDSIYKLDLLNHQKIIDEKSSTITKISKTLDTKYKIIKCTTISSSVLFLICLLRK